MKKILAIAAAAALTAGVSAYAANPFSDVSPDDWAYQAVSDLSDQGVVEGYPDGTFKGERNMTRYELAQVIARLMAREDQLNAEQKATLDKLAGEYADELANLGVRVSNLEKKVIVHVSGHVMSPGVYELLSTDRVEAAVEAAGGMSEDADANGLNLARVVQDGEQIYVPGLATDDTAINQSSASSSASSASTSSKSSSHSAGSAGSSRTQKVNINTADANELCSLPGVGQSTAQKIITYRQTEGRFATKEDLKQVSGIGEKKYAALADFITV